MNKKEVKFCKNCTRAIDKDPHPHYKDLAYCPQCKDLVEFYIKKI
jgi:phage FluMu protein Com